MNFTQQQPELFDLVPQRSPLLVFPDAGVIRSAINELPPCGIAGIWSPSRCGASSSILKATQHESLSLRINFYTSFTQEDGLNQSLYALGIHFGCMMPGKKGEQVTKRAMIEAIKHAIKGERLDVMVFEHLEFEEQDFHRAIVAISRELWKEGVQTRFIVHFTGHRKHHRRMDSDMESALTFKINLEAPDPVRVFSVFCMNLINQPEKVREFVERNPRPDSVTEFFNRVVELAEGDMVYAVNMARRVNYLFGSLEVDESYFEKLNSYLAENEKSPLYTRKGR